MNWSDERYVRLYVRDTTDWLVMPWQSRALLPLLLRKADRCGAVPFGRHGAAGLAVLVGLPPEVVQVGLAGLLDDGCITSGDGHLVFRNYLEAQESARSDKLRARESRERRAEILSRNVTKESQTVTASSQIVTESHDVSQLVTPCHAVSLRAVPCRAVPNRSVHESQNLALVENCQVAPTGAPVRQADGGSSSEVALFPAEPAKAKPRRSPRRKPEEDASPTSAETEGASDEERSAADRWIAAAWRVSGAPMPAKPWAAVNFMAWRRLWRKVGIEDMLRSLAGLETDQWWRSKGVNAYLSNSAYTAGLAAAANDTRNVNRRHLEEADDDRPFG